MPCAGYACPIYSRTGRVTEGSEVRRRGICDETYGFSSRQVHSLGMVMLELLTGLAPATADPSRPGAKSLKGGRYSGKAWARPGGIAYQVADAISWLP